MRPWSIASPFLFGSIAALVACAGDDSADPMEHSPDGERAEPIDRESGEPAIRIVGRADTRDPRGPRVAWPGVRIVARFEGTSANVRLKEASRPEGPSRFAVVVDGAVSGEPLVPSEGEADYEIANGLPSGVHTVELRRLTEAQVGTTQLIKLTFAGGKLLPAPRSPTRRIEFLGDSTSSGYGIEGIAECSFSGATQNDEKTYAALVAKDLDAEYSHLAYSGKGVLQNGDRDDTDVFERVYQRALPDDPGSTWAFPESTRADVVFINLGGNDWDQTSDAFDPPDIDAFAAKYVKLVKAIRKGHPSAIVLAALGPSQTDEHPEGFEAYTNGKAALQRAVGSLQEAGDERVHYFEPSRLTDEYRTGCDGHPNAEFHMLLAQEIAGAIKEKTGW